MAHRDFDTLYPLVASDAYGCPDHVLRSKLRIAAIEVCRRSHRWQHQLSTIVSQGQRRVSITGLPTDARVDGIRYPRLADTTSRTATPSTLTFLPVGQIYEKNPNWFSQDEAAQGTPLYITEEEEATFSLVPVPERSYYVLMTLILTPSADANGMEGSVMDDLQLPIMHYALRDLMVMPDMPWQNHELASYHAKQAIKHIDRARAETALGRGGEPLVAQGRPFVRRRRYY